MKLLITGGCGFVGHHFIEHFLKTTNWDIISFDKLTYASSGFDRVRDIDAFDDSRVSIFSLDFTKEISEGVLKECSDIDYIFHMGAETHVDNSLVNPAPFVYANVIGTMHMLEFARKQPKLRAFVYFSTDEVFGPAPEGTNYDEWARYNSTNPYSATKAGGEELVLAYMNSFGVPGFITHCMNIFGERQHPEKYIPLCINKISKGEGVTIHGTPDKKKSGSRFYIHARNVANAIHFLINKFEQSRIYTRDKFNIVGEKELTNLELAQAIANNMEMPLNYDIVDFHSARPGHDLRYALDGSKMEALGWKVPMTIYESLRSTILWTLDNPQWMENK